MKVRRESVAEAGLIANATPGKTIRGLYLQPDPVPAFDGELRTLFFQRATGEGPAIIQRLAEQLGADHKGLTLVGKRGERVVFGCSRRIRHTLSPDNSSLTFAAKEDLTNHWLVALTLRLDRDWTWDALRHVSFEIFREKRFQSDPDAEVDDNGGKPIGDWEVVPTASLQALDNARRDHTTLIFLDAVEPKPELPQLGHAGETRFPDVIELDYRVEARFQGAPEAAPLPAAAPRAAGDHAAGADPAHRLGGLALSEYKRNDPTRRPSRAAASSGWSSRSPSRDPNDAYFIRLLGDALPIRCSPTTAWRRSRRRRSRRSPSIRSWCG